MNGNGTPLFQGEKLCKHYSSGNGKIEILKDVDIAVNKGEMLAIVGASGSGKTTLLQILGTLDTPDSGKLLFKNKDLCTQNANDLCKFRNKSVGFIFQFHHLLPEFTALENVMMPGLIAGKSKDALHDPAMELLNQVELAHRSDHRVNELSGGEQQRTALARALIMKPSLLLADEPTGNLDARSGNIVFSLLRNLCNELALATIMVTHNQELAEQMDRTAVLNDKVLTPQS